MGVTDANQVPEQGRDGGLWVRAQVAKRSYPAVTRPAHRKGVSAQVLRWSYAKDRRAEAATTPGRGTRVAGSATKDCTRVVAHTELEPLALCERSERQLASPARRAHALRWTHAQAQQGPIRSGTPQ